MGALGGHTACAAVGWGLQACCLPACLLVELTVLHAGGGVLGTGSVWSLMRLNQQGHRMAGWAVMPFKSRMTVPERAFTNAALWAPCLLNWALCGGSCQVHDVSAASPDTQQLPPGRDKERLNLPDGWCAVPAPGDQRAWHRGRGVCSGWSGCCVPAAGLKRPRPEVLQKLELARMEGGVRWSGNKARACASHE